MKKILSFFAVLAVVALPVMAQAATFVSGSEYSRSSPDRVSDNLYAVGGTLSIASDVAGDVLAAGGTIILSGHISGDVAVAGGTIQVLGPVSGDARIAGGQITISDRVGGDLVVMGGTVHLLSSSTVAGSVYINGGQVIIDGTVAGSARINGGRLTINGSVAGPVTAKVSQALVLGPQAQLHNTVDYRAPGELQMADGAHITGKVTYNQTTKLHLDKAGAVGLLLIVATAITAVQMLAYLGMVALLVWHWRRWTLSIMQDAVYAFWSSVGHGLVYAIIVPICVVLLLMSLIGIIPAVILALIYVAVGILSKVIAGMFLGAWLSKIIRQQQLLEITWLNALGGTVLMFLLAFIPLLGWIIPTLLMLALFGVLIRQVQKHIL